MMEFAFAPGTFVPDMQKGAGELGCGGVKALTRRFSEPACRAIKTSWEEGK